MPDPSFPLQPAERELLDQIKFDVRKTDGFQNVQKNGELIAQLLRNLIARSAIPEIRLKYFTDPDLNPGGRGKSRKQVFEQNGTTGTDIYRHTNFVKFFEYFLSGPALPEHIIEAFEAKVESCGPLTSGDIIPLGDFARQPARSFSASPGSEAEEFYKLALECDIWPSYAEMIMKSVKQAKSLSRRL